MDAAITAAITEQRSDSMQGPQGSVGRTSMPSSTCDDTSSGSSHRHMRRMSEHGCGCSSFTHGGSSFMHGGSGGSSSAVCRARAWAQDVADHRAADTAWAVDWRTKPASAGLIATPHKLMAGDAGRAAAAEAPLLPPRQPGGDSLSILSCDLRADTISVAEPVAEPVTVAQLSSSIVNISQASTSLHLQLSKLLEREQAGVPAFAVVRLSSAAAVAAAAAKDTGDA